MVSIVIMVLNQD